MAFIDGETLFLEDDAGKRSWFRMSSGMIKIGSMGTVDGKRLDGCEDGSRITLVGKEYTVFRPTTKDLMDSLERGAQIITPKDAATVIMNCGIRPGETIIEVGAGSGGLSTALVSAVAPSGRVLTVEIKEENAQRVQRNLKRTGLDEYWSYVIGDAKTVPVDIVADVLTMDMPDPWLALDNLLPRLRSGGRICAYVPNMNQAESIVTSLRERDFAGVYALENIQRGLDVHPGGVRPSFETLGHTGYLIFGRKRA